MAGPLVVWILAISAFTMLRFRQDKASAIAGGWRVPESNLLALALIGGSPGALLARHVFRHKTRKEPFGTQLMVIAAMQLGAGGALLLF